MGGDGDPDVVGDLETAATLEAFLSDENLNVPPEFVLIWPGEEGVKGQPGENCVQSLGKSFAHEALAPAPADPAEHRLEFNYSRASAGKNGSGFFLQRERL